ncbi:MAG: PfkB family carbohydrate kinase [Deinococcales bacterium]
MSGPGDVDGGAVGHGGGAPEALPVHLIGNVNLDIVMGPVKPWPAPGTERIVERQEVRVGGAAGVAAMALQALGAPYRLHARIGDDAFGARVRDELGPAGAQLEIVPADTAYSVGVTHPDGERTFFTYLGHLAELDLDGIARELETAEPGMVLVCGYFLLPPLRHGGALPLMRRAREAGHRVLFDSGWPSGGFTDTVRQELDALLPSIDRVLPNEAEALGWAATSRLEEAVDRLQRYGARVTVKRGGEGASWLERGEMATRAAPRVPVADSVGAGDCFNAAYVAALARGARNAAAVDAAVRYAADVVQRRPRDYGRST